MTVAGRCSGSPARRGRPPNGASTFPPPTSRCGAVIRGVARRGDLLCRAIPFDAGVRGKTLTLGGSCSKQGGIVTGDLSALLVERTPFWSGWFRTPRRETALLPDFNEKVERICRECSGERVTAFAGVPSWNLALLRRMVEFTGGATCAKSGRTSSCSCTAAWDSSLIVRRSAN